jgi:hypothetical protein
VHCNDVLGNFGRDAGGGIIALLVEMLAKGHVKVTS